MDSERPVKNLFLIYIYMPFPLVGLRVASSVTGAFGVAILQLLTTRIQKREKVKLLCHECIKKYQNNLFSFVVQNSFHYFCVCKRRVLV